MNEKIRIFCELDEMMEPNISEITLDYIQFNYKNYTVFIFSEEPLKVNQLDYEIPFLYNEKQEITINEEIDKYQFKFKIESYKEDILFIYHNNSYIILDDCSKDNRELICEIDKDQLEENLVISKNTAFKLKSFHDSLGTVSFNSVLDININFNISEKKDIIVDITNILCEVSESGATVAYETNITDIPNMLTDFFEMSFYDLLGDEYINGSCYFKKNSKDAMLFLCNIIGDGYLFILETENITILNDISYKYNFVILPIENYDVIEVVGEGTEILLTYPNILNYTIEEEFTIKYIMPYPHLANNIKLNSQSNATLNCSNIGEVKTCSVPIDHFTNKKTDYYYTYHDNHEN